MIKDVMAKDLVRLLALFCHNERSQKSTYETKGKAKAQIFRDYKELYDLITF